MGFWKCVSAKSVENINLKIMPADLAMVFLRMKILF